MTYYGSARACYSDSQISNTVTTTGITVMSPTPYVLVSWTGATSLSASWAAVAGAAGYEYALGSSAGASDVVDWTTSGTELSMTHNGLSPVANQSYYVSVRTFDAYGPTGLDNRSAATTSPPIEAPTPDPTVAPTSTPTAVPTASPTDTATVVPTSQPTATPTSSPTAAAYIAPWRPSAPAATAVLARVPNAMPLVYPIANGSRPDLLPTPVAVPTVVFQPTSVSADPVPTVQPTPEPALAVQPTPAPANPTPETALAVSPTPAWLWTGVTIEVAISATDGEPSGASPSIVTASAPPDALLAADGDLERFVLAWFDASTGTWQILPTWVNADGTLSAESDQPGTFALLERTATILAEPAPDADAAAVIDD